MTLAVNSHASHVGLHHVLLGWYFVVVEKDPKVHVESLVFHESVLEHGVYHQ